MGGQMSKERHEKQKKLQKGGGRKGRRRPTNDK
jgi:hypothetical protein